MLVHFSKMHGLGNDFVVLDLISQHYRPTHHDMKMIADRHFGIGCDQILLVEAPQHPENDFKYRIFNADGNEVEQCGNGARCFALYVRQKGLIGKDSMRVETENGIIELHLEDDSVRVNMGTPNFSPASLPFDAQQQALEYELDVNGQSIHIGAVSMGNPHAVTIVENTENAAVETLGPAIESHERFAKNVNAGFLQILSQHEAKLRVYERGVGETLACGSGACAAVSHGIQKGLLTSPVAIHLLGGKLNISWQGEGHDIHMTGPAEFVFEGKIRL